MKLLHSLIVEAIAAIGVLACAVAGFLGFNYWWFSFLSLAGLYYLVIAIRRFDERRRRE
jgi:membrane protein YqaA with SNARE-associated domain